MKSIFQEEIMFLVSCVLVLCEEDVIQLIDTKSSKYHLLEKAETLIRSHRYTFSLCLSSGC